MNTINELRNSLRKTKDDYNYVKKTTMEQAKHLLSARINELENQLAQAIADEVMKAEEAQQGLPLGEPSGKPPKKG